MSLSEVTVNISGGLGLPLAGKDHITGLLLYCDEADYPSGILKKWVTATAYLEDDVVEDSTNQKLYTVQGDYTSGANVAADVGTADLIEITGATNLRNARIKQVYKNQLTSFGFIEGGISDQFFYILDNYFKANPDGYLWVGCYSENLATVTFDEVAQMQLAADGDMRKCGIYNNGTNAAFALVHATSIEARYDELVALKTPMSFVYCPIVYGEVYGSFLDLRSTGNNKSVAVFNSFDLAVNDAEKPGIGTHLGYWAISKVSESLGHVGSYNYVQEGDLDTLAILDSSGLIKYTDLSNAELTTLDTKAWCFLRKYPSLAGSYLNYHHTVAASSFDFNRVELTTTTDKAGRNVRLFCLPLISSEVTFNDDGSLRSETISLFQNAAERALDPMLAATEISAYEVTIDPTQDVQGNSNIDITVDVVVNGISKTITVNLTTVSSL